MVKLHSLFKNKIEDHTEQQDISIFWSKLVFDYTLLRKKTLSFCAKNKQILLLNTKIS